MNNYLKINETPQINRRELYNNPSKITIRAHQAPKNHQNINCVLKCSWPVACSNKQLSSCEILITLTYAKDLKFGDDLKTKT